MLKSWHVLSLMGCLQDTGEKLWEENTLQQLPAGDMLALCLPELRQLYNKCCFFSCQAETSIGSSALRILFLARCYTFCFVPQTTFETFAPVCHLQLDLVMLKSRFFSAGVVEKSDHGYWWRTGFTTVFATCWKMPACVVMKIYLLSSLEWSDYWLTPPTSKRRPTL